MPSLRLCSLFICLMLAPGKTAWCSQLPIIDAHSQVNHQVQLDRVIPVLDKAGVSRTILSFRGKIKEKTFLSFVTQHPERITPSIRTKSLKYEKNTPEYYTQLQKRLDNPTFQAMAELILWHSAKGDRAGKRVVEPDAPQVQAALDGALRKGWPLVMHIEFADARHDKKPFMVKMTQLLSSYPDHPFALIHMGQLPPDEVQRLIEAYSNLFFITSKASPFFIDSKPQWINMFSNGKLKPAWQELMKAHPDRFILALDAVWAEDWGTRYIEEAALWRSALQELPEDVAHAVAHKNAEQLWHLPSAQ